ncbi:MAG: thioredoxin family protein [Pseudomonadota bacterium]
MVLTETPVCHFGQAAIEFSLPDYDGTILTLHDCQGESGTLVMFICNHCPYVKAIQTRLVEDAHALAALGIKCVAIMSNDPTDYPEDSVENMKVVAEEFAYPFPYLFDHTQEIARAYGAVCTPDFFGYNKQLELQYRGRLDSSGKQAVNANTRRDLVEAMQQVAETGQGPQQQIPSIGCSIKWKQT